MTPAFNRRSHDKKNKTQDRSKLRKAQSLVSIAYKTFPSIMLIKNAGSAKVKSRYNTDKRALPYPHIKGYTMHDHELTEHFRWLVI